MNHTISTEPAAPTAVSAIGSQPPQVKISPAENCGSSKKYQPDRQDILWNTCWGIDKTSLSSEQAEAQGLVPFKGRWVSAEAKETLKTQLRSYLGVHQVAALLVLSAVWKLPWYVADLAPKMPSHEARTLLLIGMAVMAAAQIISAFGLYWYKRWAYWSAIGLIALSIVMDVITGDMLAVAIWVAGLYYILRETSRRFFQKANLQQETSAGKILDSKDLPLKTEDEPTMPREYFSVQTLRLTGSIFILFGAVCLLILAGPIIAIFTSNAANGLNHELQVKAARMILSNGIAGAILVLAGMGLIRFKKWSFTIAIGIIVGLFAIPMFRLVQLPILSVEPAATLVPHPTFWLFLGPILLLLLLRRPTREIFLRTSGQHN